MFKRKKQVEPSVTLHAGIPLDMNLAEMCTKIHAEDCITVVGLAKRWGLTVNQAVKVTEHESFDPRCAGAISAYEDYVNHSMMGINNLNSQTIGGIPGLYVTANIIAWEEHIKSAALTDFQTDALKDALKGMK